MKNNQTRTDDPEIVAISEVYNALKTLEADAQSRVLNYVAGKLKISPPPIPTRRDLVNTHSEETDDGNVTPRNAKDHEEQESDDLEGISPIAKKWMVRNTLNANQLSTIFSLGVDEIDLIAKTVPGKKKTEKMRSVFLLKGISAYLGTGVARFTYQQAKEACLHYGAFDAANFAANISRLAAEVSGDKSSGYTLTPRGLTSATAMIKAMSQPSGMS